VQKGKKKLIFPKNIYFFQPEILFFLFSLFLNACKIKLLHNRENKMKLVSPALFLCLRNCRMTNSLFREQVPKTHTSFKEEQECKTVTDKQCKKVEKTVCH
jgi:hypothetical protein